MKDMGEHVETIGSKKFLPAVGGIAYLAVAVLLLYLIFIRKIVSYEVGEATYFKVIMCVIIGVMVLSAIYQLVSILRNKVEFYEKGMILYTAMRKTEVDYSAIDSFQWTRRTQYIGFIPISRSYYLTIMGSAGPIVQVGSGQYSKMRAKFSALEAKLAL